MDAEFWLNRWQKNEIGFHAEEVQPALVKYWPLLGLAPGARVLVPLCGKSLDMAWLAEQGHPVVGAELSAIAVRDFFAGQGLTPRQEERGGFEISRAPSYELWCGDFFSLKKADVAVAAAYDRAALVAMPPAMQPRYAAKMAELLPQGAKTLLISLDYDPREIEGPPFNITHARVDELFSATFNVSRVDAREGLSRSEHLRKRGITWLEEATYLLERK